MRNSLGTFVWCLIVLMECFSVLEAAAIEERHKRGLHEFHDEGFPDFEHESISYSKEPEELHSFDDEHSSYGHLEGGDGEEYSPEFHHSAIHSDFHEKPVRGINHGKGAFSYSTLYASKEIE